MLTRKTPLRRVPFKSKPPAWLPREERTRAPLQPIRVPTAAKPVFRPCPKREYVRSDRLLEAVRWVPWCMRCGRDFVGGEHADPAHSNWSGHGKGERIKADDHRIAALCRIPCHAWIDASGDDWLERFIEWWAAHRLTVIYLTTEGLWPTSVPVPDIDNFPKELQ